MDKKTKQYVLVFDLISS
eukprot:Gb_23615 [translate_table: standard]